MDLHLGAQQHVEKHMVPTKAHRVLTRKETLDSAIQESPPHSPSTGPGVPSLENCGSAREDINKITDSVFAKSK